MPPAEFWWLVSAKMPEFDKTQPDDIAQIARMVKASKKKEQQENG